MKRLNIIYAIILSVTLYGCGKEAVESPHVSQPLKNTISALNVNVTAVKSVVNVLEVFIIDRELSNQLTYKRYLQQELAFTAADSSWTLKEPLQLKTGTKWIYIGVNLPESVSNTLKQSYANFTAPFNLNIAELTNGGFMSMFSEKIDEFEVKASPQENIFTTKLVRLVAKASITVPADLSYHVSAGTLSDLKYTTGNLNKKIFVAPLVNFTDPNWLPEAYRSDDFYSVDENSFVNQGTEIFLMQNTSRDHLYREVSYICLRAKFSPDRFQDTNGGPNTNADGTFYAVFSHDGTFYFTGQANALQYINSNRSRTASNPLTYRQGYCYYRVYLNSGDSDNVTGGKYDILRNTIYQASIAKINSIGTAGKDDLNGSPGTPGNPGAPIIPDQPVGQNSPVSPLNYTTVDATIKITPWVVKNRETEVF